MFVARAQHYIIIESEKRTLKLCSATLNINFYLKVIYLITRLQIGMYLNVPAGQVKTQPTGLNKPFAASDLVVG